jgi:phage replication O-like protein O
MVNSGADIQTENGFVKLHPAILELLARQTLSGREFRCLMLLFRKTYGYHKKEDRISLSQWEQGTGIPRTRVGAVLAELVEKKIVTKTDNGANRPATWGFNKHFETWQGDETVTLEGTTLNETVTLEGDKTVTLQGDHNRKKDTNTPTVSAGADVQPSFCYVEQFREFQERLKTSTNRPAVLREFYIWCFGESTAPEYGYLGKTAKQVGGAGRLAQLMFELVTRPPTGDVLAHIIATENARKKRSAQTGGNREISELQFTNGGDIYA